MARATYVWRDGALVDKRFAAPLVTRFGRAPAVIRDGLDDVVHPITQRPMDSKSAFRRITREHGCIEVGNELPAMDPAPAPAGIAADVARAFEQTEHHPAAAAADFGITDWT